MIKVLCVPIKYQIICTECGCIFTYTEADLGGVKIINCPHCGNKLSHKSSKPIYEGETKE